MLTTRTSLIALIAVGTLGLANTTANASPCFFSRFTNPGKAYSQRVVKKPAKFYTAPKVNPIITARPKVNPIITARPKVNPIITARPKVNPIVTARPKVDPVIAKPEMSYAQAKKPIKVASPASPVLSSLSRPFESNVAGAAVSAPAQQAATTCLTKEYLETGTVKFNDTCTKEWGINATDVAKPDASGSARSCLTKETHRNGVVMFKDTCTNEWAMNTAEQQVKAD